MITTDDNAETSAVLDRIASVERDYRASMRVIHRRTAALFIFGLLVGPAAGLLAYWVLS